MLVNIKLYDETLVAKVIKTGEKRSKVVLMTSGINVNLGDILNVDNRKIIPIPIKKEEKCCSQSEK